jgi:hypothetical protein
MQFDSQDLSWKSRHDARTRGSGTWRLVLALVLIAGAAIAAQVESSLPRARRARVVVTAATTSEAP